MRAIKYRELKQLHESLGAKKFTRHLSDSLKSGELKAEDFSIRELAEAEFGHEFIGLCNPRNGPGKGLARIIEGDGVDSTAFSNITGQIVFSKILEAFQNATLAITPLVENIPTNIRGEEKFPGLSRTGDVSQEVHEGMPYPRAGFGEDYTAVPPVKKYGHIVPITKEAIFDDKTGLILRMASEVGEWLGVTKEKLIADMVAGCATTFATGGKWKWKGSEYDVYNSTTVDFASYWYINAFTDVLTDWTDIDAAFLLFSEMRDPYTREPINLNPTLTLLTPPALTATVTRFKSATEVRVGTGSGTVPMTISPNPVRSFDHVESMYLYRRLIDTATAADAAAAAKYWFLGDFRKAFAWREAWAITPSQAPVNSQDEFDRDIVAQYKASMCGGPAVLKPHYVIRSTGAGS